MKPRTFLILLTLILLVGGLFNYYAFQSLQRTAEGGGASVSSGEKQRPAVLAAAQEKMRERGWVAGGGTGAGNGVSRFQGAIMQTAVAEFQRVPFPDGVPAYDGEAVTAYVEVPSSGKKVALMPNQSGEYPKVLTQPGEAVEVRLAFTRSQPGDPVAVSVQDGGVLHVGKMAGMLPVDAERQLGFGFVVSPNPGIHRITFTTGGGEVKTLNFWAGPEHTVNTRIVAQLAGKPAGK